MKLQSEWSIVERARPLSSETPTRLTENTETLAGFKHLDLSIQHLCIQTRVTQHPRDQPLAVSMEMSAAALGTTAGWYQVGEDHYHKIEMATADWREETEQAKQWGHLQVL